MSKNPPRLRRAALQSSKDPRRSPLFHWLSQHHRQLLGTQAGRCRDWAPLLAKAIEAGVTDDRGAAPTERLMRDTWRKVRKDMEVKAGAQAGSPKPPRKLQPRDMPADWRPTPLPAAAAPSTLVVPNPAPEASEERRRMTGAEARLSLRQVLLQRSGRTE